MHKGRRRCCEASWCQSAIKDKKVLKKKKMSVTAQKKIRDDRFFAGLDLDTDV